MGKSLYRKYVLFALGFCVAVILWGAYVRATGSGAGCGRHWPLCNGAALPVSSPDKPHEKTLIEYAHRISSGISLLFVLGLFFLTRRIFPKGSFQRKVAKLAALAIIVESLLGAVLVLLQLVEFDQSVRRVFAISAHLLNTLFLLATLTVLFLAPAEAKPRWRWPDPVSRRWPLGLLLGFGALGALGALAALGDTLFPADSLSAGVLADFDGKRHFLERIRIFHPVFAILWVGALAWWLADVWARIPALKQRGRLTLALALLNLGLGLLNVLLLAPVWLQMLHLFVADLLWIFFVSLIFSAASRWQ